jgi:hypothetical protein
LEKDTPNMGKLVERIVTAKAFFDSSQGKLFKRGEIIQIDEDLLVSKTKGRSKAVPGLAKLSDAAEKRAPDTPPVAKPRGTGEKDKTAAAKPRGAKGEAAAAKPSNVAPEKAEDAQDETAEDLDVEEGGAPRGSSVLD